MQNYPLNRREQPDLSNSYMPPPGVAPASNYNTHNAQFQHSTPAPQHLPDSSVSLAGLNKLDLQFNLLANGKIMNIHSFAFATKNDIATILEYANTIFLKDFNVTKIFLMVCS